MHFLPRLQRLAPAVSIGATALSLCLLFGACASYPERTQSAFRDFQGGQLGRALQAYEDKETTGSPFLRHAESGMVALVDGRFDKALEHFNGAAEVTREIEDRALVSAEDLGESILSFAINDTVVDYKGEGYERLMVRAGLALSYLALGNYEGARVEIRRANQLLEREEELYEKKYAAGGLGHFLSAVAYELDGEPDQAYIDYKRMLSKNVGVELAGRAAVRLARKLARDDELPELEARFGAGQSPDPEAANIVVIAGIGLGPYKREVGMTLPGKHALIQWAVPTLERRPQATSDVELSITGGAGTVRTSIVEDVADVAAENLNDRIAWLALKSATRAGIKYEVSRQLGEEHGAAGAILGALFTIATERADLRAWQTLPDTWQAARVFVPAGRHELVLSTSNGQRTTLGTFDLRPRETMFVYARTIEQRLFAHAVGGDRVEAENRAAEPTAPTTP